MLRLSQLIRKRNFAYSPCVFEKVAEKRRDTEVYLLEKLPNDKIFRLTIYSDGWGTSYLLSQDRINQDNFLSEMYWSTVPEEKEHIHLI